MKMIQRITGVFWFFICIHSSFANVALDELAALEKQKATQSSITPSATTTFTPSATQFTKNHALVLFFSSTCHFCQGFSPVVKQWSQNQGYALEAYTTNGIGLPDFPHVPSLTPTLKSMYFGQESVIVPALFLVNTQNHQAYPVSIGYLNETELEARMKNLIQAVKHYEQGGSIPS